MLDSLPESVHGFWVCIKSPLHGLKYMLSSSNPLRIVRANAIERVNGRKCFDPV
jgi:hypothetical protein